jgi:hypothetical protein
MRAHGRNIRKSFPKLELSSQIGYIVALLEE